MKEVLKMIILKFEERQHIHVNLELNIDFKMDDLESPWCKELKELNSDSLHRIAKEKGFDGWEWSGHFNPDNNTCEVEFYNIIKKN